MCLILFGVNTQPDLPLVVAANRDEFYARPALAAHFWEDAPHVLAGRDLEASGTWLGITRTGRFAAVTNFADPADNAPLSRGALPADFLNGNASASAYAQTLDGPQYRGYNLLLWDGVEMLYTSNKLPTKEAPARVLSPGFYGLSNAELGATWPKAIDGSAALQRLTQGEFSTNELVELLANDRPAEDSRLPKRGREIEFERRVAPCFIRGEEYGTRASTAVIFTSGQVNFSEQLYGAMGRVGERSNYQFDMEG